MILINFYYDPILGLQYATFEDNSNMVMDITMLNPIKDMQVQDILKLLKEQGISLVNAREIDIKVFQYAEVHLNGSLTKMDWIEELKTSFGVSCDLCLQPIENGITNHILHLEVCPRTACCSRCERYECICGFGTNKEDISKYIKN